MVIGLVYIYGLHVGFGVSTILFTHGALSRELDIETAQRLSFFVQFPSAPVLQK